MSLLLNTNATHDLALTSRVESANTPGCDFPIQNLPWGRYRPAGSVVAWKIGVAIGDQILDARAAGVIDTDDMNKLMARSPAERLAPPLASLGRTASWQQTRWQALLTPQASAELTLPCRCVSAKAAPALAWTQVLPAL